MLSKSVAILTGPSTHLDHLGILSALLQIPLIVTDPHTLKLARRYYPQIDVHLMDLADLTLDFLAEHFDVIFESSKFWAAELGPALELFYRKKMRFVFCPHGNSDKGHSLTSHPNQDIYLVYGDHLSDHLLDTGALMCIQHLIRTGNYRHAFYLKHRAFYDAIIQEEIFQSIPSSKPTLLYAPTWQDRENASSFFELTDSILERLNTRYHVLMKPHPFLIEDHPELIERYATSSLVHLINDMPLIYPLLNRCDAYLGDHSSIGYDFLTFNRPMYFCKASPHSPLLKCGDCIDNPTNKDYSAEQQKLYRYVFGEEKPFEQILNEIAQVTLGLPSNSLNLS